MTFAIFKIDVEMHSVVIYRDCRPEYDIHRQAKKSLVSGTTLSEKGLENQKFNSEDEEATEYMITMYTIGDW